MPLIQSPSQSVAAAILERIKSAAANYNAAASHLNGIVSDLLALSDVDLAAFANQLGPVALGELTTMHGEHGASVTELSSSASSVLAESGVLWPASIVDVRPLFEKLAEQGREMSFTNGVFAVTRFPEDPPIEEP